MSGTRLFSFREGDRSEYLAQYFFSAFGLVTPIPRQEDIGFDFVCSIADQEAGRLSFNNQFLISVKSFGSPCIDLKPAPSDSESLLHMAWLFQLELPLLLAVVEKESQEIRVFSTLPIWFIRYAVQCHDCGALTLKPRLDDSQTGDVTYPTRGESLPGRTGANHYTVDLGFPVMRANLADLASIDRLRELKERLRIAVDYGFRSSIYRQLGVPYFYWFAHTQPDGSQFVPSFFAGDISDSTEANEYLFSQTAPVWISLAMRFRRKGDEPLFRSVVNLLRLVPPDRIPLAIMEALPEISQPTKPITP